ncbi:hypothetical protein GGR56DRAFT_678606 [Xylariaceae sp. FL0804]|nr:hypothetical protein GGR56DRAFT_678606 [Xylariaceae sp. FL0804]
MSAVPSILERYSHYSSGEEEDADLAAAMSQPAYPRMSKKPKQTPQEAIDEFWSKFTTKAPGKATTIIPHNKYAEKAARRSHKRTGTTAQASYEEAAEVCRAKVDKIVKECRRINQKYRDPHFDLEVDLKWGSRDTLETLSNRVGGPAAAGRGTGTGGFQPKSVKRVVDIFDEPRFYIGGPTANDVRQGRDGDCWLLAALCTLSNKRGLIERVCVARDEAVGVYGFVFHRDGEWISEIIDDKLFLTKPDFEESFLERMLWEDRERINSEEQYRRTYQSGSGALYFAQCEEANETWLPLLEKAYAKAHGDYAAIEGGFTGEGIEDLTGGVTTELYTTDILDKEHFWAHELMRVNDEFLFGCSTGMWGGGWGDRKGIVERHAYSVMKAVEMDGRRLVLLKNPWGKGEWKGAWSDGSKEWTVEWLTKLGHRFGDDGSFWISYDDLLRRYQAFDRTRLFGPEWRVTSLWTTLDVPWASDYHDTYFALSLARAAPVVLVLSQLDDRYYRGLEGQYRFVLNFRLHRTGQGQQYVVRTISPYCQNRSINVELELAAGSYDVLLRIDAARDVDVMPVEQVVRRYARGRRDKLVRVGMSYDLAHSKGADVVVEEEEKDEMMAPEERRDAERRRRDRDRAELRKEVMAARWELYHRRVREQARARRRRARAKAKAKAKRAARAERARARRERRQQQTRAATASAATTAAVPDDGDDDGQDAASSAAAPPARGKHVQILPPGRTPAEVGEHDEEEHHGSPEPSAAAAAAAAAAASSDDDDDSDDDDTSVSSVSEISDGELDQILDRRASASSPPPPPPPPESAAGEDNEPPPPPPPLDEFESDPWNAVATVGLRVYYKTPRLSSSSSCSSSASASVASTAKSPGSSPAASPSSGTTRPKKVAVEREEVEEAEQMVKLRLVRPGEHVHHAGTGRGRGEEEEDDDDDEDDGSGSEGKSKKNRRERGGGDHGDEQEEEERKDEAGDEDGDEAVVVEQLPEQEQQASQGQGLDVDDSSKDATLEGDREQRRKSILSLRRKNGSLSLRSSPARKGQSQSHHAGEED